MAKPTDIISQLYIACFNRPADPAGLRYWSTLLAEQPQSAAAIYQGFLDSPEYQRLHVGQTQEQLVNTAYQNLFGHAPDANGKAFWLSMLADKVIGVAELNAAIAKAAQGNDLDVLNAKTATANAFIANLDSAEKIRAYSGDAANALAGRLLASVTDDPSGILARQTATQQKLIDAIVLQKGGNGPQIGGTISFDHYDHASVNGLPETLALSHGNGEVAIHNANLSQFDIDTLTLRLDDVGGGSIGEEGIYTGLNIELAGAASRLADINAAKVTSLAISGDQTLILDSVQGLSALRYVDTSGSAGLVGDFSNSNVVQIDTLSSGGTSSVTIDSAHTRFSGGGGIDHLTLINTETVGVVLLGGGDDSLTVQAESSKASLISGGDGNDILRVNSHFVDQIQPGVIEKFENLVIDNIGKNGSLALDAGLLGAPGDITLINGGDASLSNLGRADNLADHLHVVLTGNKFGGDHVLRLDAENLEHLDLGLNAAPTANWQDVYLSGASLQTLQVSGVDNTRISTFGASDLTLVDASSASGKFHLYIDHNTAASTTVLAGSGENFFSLQQAGNAIKYYGGNTQDTVFLDSRFNNEVHLGNATGQNLLVIQNGNGANTVFGGDGNDYIALDNENGDNVVYGGKGDNVLRTGNGNNTYHGGPGYDEVQFGSGKNEIFLGGNSDVTGLSEGFIRNHTPSLTVDGFSTIHDAHLGLILDFHSNAPTSFQSDMVVLQNGATFHDYANAAIAAGGDATVNLAMAWFEFEGDTYLVGSRHNGSQTPVFIDGTDQIIKLVGLLDLSHSSVGNPAGFLRT